MEHGRHAYIYLVVFASTAKVITTNPNVRPVTDGAVKCISNLREFRAHVQGLVHSSGTNFSAFLDPIQSIKEQVRAQSPGDRIVSFLLSDGEDMGRNKVAKDPANRHMFTHSIGIGSDKAYDRRQLEFLGEHFTPAVTSSSLRDHIVGSTFGATTEVATGLKLRVYAPRRFEMQSGMPYKRRLVTRDMLPAIQAADDTFRAHLTRDDEQPNLMHVRINTGGMVLPPFDGAYHIVMALDASASMTWPMPLTADAPAASAGAMPSWDLEPDVPSTGRTEDDYAMWEYRHPMAFTTFQELLSTLRCEPSDPDAGASSSAAGLGPDDVFVVEVEYTADGRATKLVRNVYGPGARAFDEDGDSEVIRLFTYLNHQLSQLDALANVDEHNASVDELVAMVKTPRTKELIAAIRQKQTKAKHELYLLDVVNKTMNLRRIQQRTSAVVPPARSEFDSMCAHSTSMVVSVQSSALDNYTKSRADAEERDAPVDDSTHLCTICLSNPRDVIYDCAKDGKGSRRGHCVVCKDCTLACLASTKNACPCCRDHVEACRRILLTEEQRRNHMRCVTPGCNNMLRVINDDCNHGSYCLGCWNAAKAAAPTKGRPLCHCGLPMRHIITPFF